MIRTLLVSALAFVVLAVSFPELAFSHSRCRGRRCYRRYPPRSRYVPHRHPRRVWADPKAGAYLGLGLLGDFISESDNELSRLMNTGGGMDFFFGMRFNRYFALELGFLGSVHSTDEQLADYKKGVFNGLTLDGKIFLLPDSPRIEPFLQVGGGGYAFYEEGYAHRELSGGGFHLGGGVDVRMNRVIGFGLRGLYKGINMDNSTEWYHATDSVFLNQMTVEGNLQIHF